MSEYWTQTYSTKKYDFYKNDPEDIDIVDIANSLAQIPRFNGHLQRPYSVAQHCMTVASALKKDGQDDYVALQGLMHDAHEPYTHDISQPLKLFLLSKHKFDWDIVEKPVKEAITEKFGIDIISYPKIVDKYDKAVKRLEAECLFDRIVDNWTHRIKYKMEDNIKTVLGVKDAKDYFLQCFEDLGGRDHK